MSIQWNGAICMAEIRSQLARNLERAAEHVAGKVRDKLRIPGPPASSPGEPPHRRSGELQGNILPLLDVTNPDQPTAYIQANTPYAEVLELGGGHVAARPFLRPTLVEESDAIERILGS